MTCLAAERAPLLPLEAFFGNPKRPDPKLEGFALAPSKRIKLKGGGRATLTLPLDAEPKSLPAVLDVQRRDRTAQWLANRGYAVLQLEPMRLSDGIRWLVRKGIADPKRIGVFGSRKGERLPSGARVAASIELPEEEPVSRLEFYAAAERSLAEALGGRIGPEVWEK